MKRKAPLAFHNQAPPSGDLVKYDHVSTPRQYDNSNAQKQWGAKLDEALKLFGKQAFRPGQLDIMLSILGGHDTLVLMPTGGGKSLCFQLPALIMPGVSVIISPLIALMQNQVDALRQLQIKASTLNSQLTEEQRARIYADLESADPKLKMLYVSPEMVDTARFKNLLVKMRIAKTLAMLVVDEAHCISMWGHDFRFSFCKLGAVKELCPGLRIAAFTATATEKVRVDIVSQLKMEKPAVFIAGFNRKNISYEVRLKPLLPNVYEDIKSVVRKYQNQPGIIYCLKKEACDSFAGKLQKDGLKAAAYHAGLKPAQRTETLTKWTRGEIDVIVGTVAFGMGIDARQKADVRFVIHEFMPKTLEGFYQESGRAGRDGKPSVSIVYYDRSDVSVFVESISRHALTTTRQTLLFVTRQEKEGKADAGGESVGAAQQFANDKKTAESLQVSIDMIEKMSKYCESDECRRKVILRHFGDPDYQKAKELCAKTCDVCNDRERVAKDRAFLKRPRESSGWASSSGGFLVKNGEYEEEEEVPEGFRNQKGYVPYEKSAEGSLDTGKGFGRFGRGSDELTKPGGFTAASRLGPLSSSPGSLGFGGPPANPEWERARARDAEKRKISETFMKSAGAEVKTKWKHLRDAQNFAQISDLSLPARTAMYEALLKGYRENAPAAPPDALERSAAAAEYAIFSACRSKASYRHGMVQKLAEVQALTKQGKAAVRADEEEEDIEEAEGEPTATSAAMPSRPATAAHPPPPRPRAAPSIPPPGASTKQQGLASFGFTTARKLADEGGM